MAAIILLCRPKLNLRWHTTFKSFFQQENKIILSSNMQILTGCSISDDFFFCLNFASACDNFHGQQSLWICFVIFPLAVVTA